MLYSATAMLGLKAENHQKIFQDTGTKFIPDVTMLWDYARDNVQPFVF